MPNRSSLPKGVGSLFFVKANQLWPRSSPVPDFVSNRSAERSLFTREPPVATLETLEQNILKLLSALVLAADLGQRKIESEVRQLAVSEYGQPISLARVPREPTADTS